MRSELVRRRRAVLEREAQTQGGVLSRQQVYASGVTRGELRAQVRARRWRRVGHQAVAVHTGPIPTEGLWWAALFEAGPRGQLDGASALVASGLERFRPRSIRVSVPRGTRVRRRRPRGVDIRETRRWSVDDLAPAGVPRTRPAVAAVRAGLWATTDREAALLLTMTVQQGLCTAEELALEMLRIRRDRRRLFLHQVVLDLIGGVRSLSELDVLRQCRRRGLPEPELQSVRRTRAGRWYLDLRWPRWGVVVEVDGIHHAWVEQVVPDALRQNSVAIEGDLVLRLPVLGLRVCPDDFWAQVAEALRSRGCRLPLDAA